MRDRLTRRFALQVFESPIQESEAPAEPIRIQVAVRREAHPPGGGRLEPGGRGSRRAGANSGRPVPSTVVKAKRYHFTLVRPVIGAAAQSCAHRIVAHVFPFLGVRFSASQLPIPEIRLPHGLLVEIGPTARRATFPVSDPRSQSRGRCAGRRTEEMQMIGHEDVPAHEPFGWVAPGGEQQLLNFRTREQWTAALNANGQEDDNGPIGNLGRRVMRRVVTRRGKCGELSRHAESDGRIVILKILNRNRHDRTGSAPGTDRH